MLSYSVSLLAYILGKNGIVWTGAPVTLLIMGILDTVIFGGLLYTIYLIKSNQANSRDAQKDGRP